MQGVRADITPAEENISDQISYDRTKGQPEVIKASSMSD
jgi:hypothetical protein